MHLIFSALALFVACGVAGHLILLVRSDGHGRRPPPPSRHDDVASALTGVVGR